MPGVNVKECYRSASLFNNMLNLFTLILLTRPFVVIYTFSQYEIIDILLVVLQITFTITIAIIFNYPLHFKCIVSMINNAVYTFFSI